MKIKFNQGKATILFSLVFLFSLLLASAVPAPDPQQFLEGYDIRIPQDNVIEAGTGYEFEFHVYNISNGVAITQDVNCSFHLYNSTGKHIYEAFDTTVNHDFDFGFYVDAGNFTKADNYYYNVYCFTPQLGGHSSSILYVTPTGFANLQGFYILILVISAGIIVLGFVLKDPPLVILGSFGLYFIGLYILFNGIVGVKDLVTTWAIALIILGVAFYISVKASWELING